LELILDKDYLISQIKNLNGRIIDNKYLNFTLLNKNNKINIFFDKQTLNLMGWQTEDVYQNLVITFISKIKTNQKIDKNIFKLPKRN
jgi:outer membrane lipoprotein-sorting protein